MKFESTAGVSVESIVQPTLFRLECDGEVMTLTVDQATALIGRLQKAIDYEYGPKP